MYICIMTQHPLAYLNTNDGSGILAFGEGIRMPIRKGQVLKDLRDFLKMHSGKFMITAFSYDLKNEIYPLDSQNFDGVCAPDAFIWVPKYAVRLVKEHVEFIQGEQCAESMNFLSNFLEEETDQNFHRYSFNFKPRIPKEEYIQRVNSLKKHIQLGNSYEVNFCQEYFVESAELDFPLDAYFKLNAITRAPFSAYLRFDELSVLCGSPERFLKKTGNTLLSQPIKGTAPRGANSEEDAMFKQQLQNDLKERAENVMIVDLVRNDLSRIAAMNSVQVDELCAIYSFETVHQMISTISCTLEEKVDLPEILKATFPMGSMTGAPKLRSMELIEEHEAFKRGLYSGSIGYILPNGDFDLNVVIRTLIYNHTNKYLSCSVGSAITILSDPEKEFEECQVKVKRLLDGMNA